ATWRSRRSERLREAAAGSLAQSSPQPLATVPGVSARVCRSRSGGVTPVSVREQQVRAVFRAALERPASERASFVADLTGDDQELRRSVELLLSNHDATDV